MTCADLDSVSLPRVPERKPAAMFHHDSPDEAEFRNGKLAVDEATRACELTHWQDPDALDTLAASCAEVGDFAAAVKWQTQALKLVRQQAPSLLQQRANSSGGGQRGLGFEDRLSFYKSRKPTRE